MPISGGSFHIQLFLALKLIKAGLNKPNIILGNSGGSINSYVLLLSGWNTNNIKKILTKIDSSVYSNSWWVQPLDKVFPSYLLGYFRGSLYNNGTGFCNIFKEMSHNIKDIEVWSLKVNFKTIKGKLSCNSNSSILNLTGYNYTHNNIESIVYNDGDVDKISNDCISSCSIPMMVPAKKDGDDYYVDGGLLYASPLSPLMNPITKTSDNFHLIYISSFDMEDDACCKYGDILDNTKNTVDNIMLGPSLLDRENAIKMISSNPNYEEGKCSIKKLSHLLTIRDKYIRTLIEIYPYDYIKLNINNFNYEDIHRDYKRFVSSGYGYRFWYC